MSSFLGRNLYNFLYSFPMKRKSGINFLKVLSRHENNRASAKPTDHVLPIVIFELPLSESLSIEHGRRFVGKSQYGHFLADTHPFRVLKHAGVLYFL